MPFTRVAALQDLWNGELRACNVLGRRVLLVKLDGEVKAYEDRCAHLGVALSAGTLEGHVLTCAAHLWQYDARTGQGINPGRVCLRGFVARVVGGEVFVDVESEGGAGGDVKPARDRERHDHVGPILEACDTAHAVVAAIRKLNRDVFVQDRGSYLRVLVPGACVVTRAAIEKELGHPFQLPGDLEQLMPSFKGMLDVNDHAVSWTWKAGTP